jgi:hypothetical protein
LIRHRLPPAEDHINNALIHRFQVVDWPRWREVFGVEYTHATGLAIQSAASYHTNRAAWMRLQNSFNHILFLRLQDVLARRGLAGTVKTIDSRGQPVSFGTMVQPTNPFDRSYPVIAKALRNFNKRRNALPDSLPYAGGLPTTHLSGREQRTYRDALRAAYNQISIEFDPLL